MTAPLGASDAPRQMGPSMAPGTTSSDRPPGPPADGPVTEPAAAAADGGSTGAGTAEAALRFLRERGVDDTEAERARRGGWLSLLVIDQAFMPGVPRLDEADVIDRTGADVEAARQLWRAMGFPAVPPGVRAFTEADVEALRLLPNQQAILTTGTGASAIDFVRQTRLVSSGLARVAEVVTDGLATVLERLRAAGLSDEAAASMLAGLSTLTRFEELVVYVLRRQLRAAVWRRIGAQGSAGTTTELAVGFVDLVGYTTLSAHLPADELAGLVDRFEARAYDVVAELGGRVVKTIGDEVMFVADAARDAVHIAVGLVDAADADEVLPPARAGVASGEVVARAGDYFGPVVNLASRIEAVARRSTVVVPATVHDALKGDVAFTWRRLPARWLPDIGVVRLWAVRHADGPAPGSHGHRHRGR